ncbi:hypothetical protein VNI00_003066 [Paramarasmius palmivorus]|uniref:Nephrocystin 3-like N-terminal domain-containing protein n=1 Tax=Paramarasmius palmivorus TaxID=297713 RepID=A0AAW0E138_9AGAR
MRVQWVHGGAGVGKSAIAQKTAENHQSHLVGVFFFSRNDSTRDRLDPLVATIAYQCCISYHLGNVLGPLILDVIRSDPNIFAATARVQFRKLILEPFFKAYWSLKALIVIPNVLIVDGIDECIHLPSQQKLIDIIDDAITFQTPIPFKFILCSRPEPSIYYSIRHANFAVLAEGIEVSGATVKHTGYLTESDLDIQKYLLEKFAELRKKHHYALKYEGELWPSGDEVINLVERASGQFIFATTVINYLDTSDELPQDQLKDILSTEPDSILPESPYSALDMLYQQILSNCRYWAKVYPIIQFIITSHPSVEWNTDTMYYVAKHSPYILTRIFKLQPGKIEILLSKLHSVIHVPHDADSSIRIRHASFTEFLLNKARSGDYYVPQYSKAQYCDLIAGFLLCTLSSYTSYYPLKSNQSFDAAFTKWKSKVDIKYDSLEDFATAFWPVYCYQVDTPSASLLAELEHFNPFVIGALAIPGEYTLTFLVYLTKCLQWAKSLGTQSLQTFIERTETFLNGFYIGFSRKSLQNDAIRRIIYSQYSLSILSSKMDMEQEVKVVIFAWETYSAWWKTSNYQRQYPLLLPITSDPSKILPNDWVVVQITPTNGKREVLKMMYDIWKALKGNSREVFDDDIINNTSNSVTCNLVKKEDLAAIKRVLYKWGDQLACLASKD